MHLPRLTPLIALAATWAAIGLGAANAGVIHAIAEAEPIHRPSKNPIQLHVFYESDELFDRDSFGNDDVSVEGITADGIAISLDVELIELGVEEAYAEVLYKILPPEEAWTIGAEFVISLRAGGVRTLEGTESVAMEIGHFPVHIEPGLDDVGSYLISQRQRLEPGSDEKIEFMVRYESTTLGVIDTATIGTGDLTARAAWIDLVDFFAPPHPWLEEIHVPTFVDLSVSENGAIVDVRYSVTGPSDGWVREVSGPLQVTLKPGEVKDDSGISAKGRILGDVSFQVGGVLPVEFEVILDVSTDVISKETEAVEFRVHYIPLESPLDAQSLGNGEIFVQSQPRSNDDGTPAPTYRWTPEIVDVEIFDPSGADGAVATYKLSPPDSGWDEKMNGIYDVGLAGGIVKATDGGVVEGRLLWELSIDLGRPSKPVFPALRVDGPSFVEGSSDPLDFYVYYSALGKAVDPSTIGDGDVVVQAYIDAWPVDLPVGHGIDGEPGDVEGGAEGEVEDEPFHPWFSEAHPASLVALKTDPDGAAQAQYRVAAPEGGWTLEMSAPIIFFLQSNEVSFLDGQPVGSGVLEERYLEIRPAETGFFDVALGIRQTEKKVFADVKVASSGQRRIVDWGEPQREGNVIILNATSVENEDVIDDAIIDDSHTYCLLELPEVVPTDPIKFRQLDYGFEVGERFQAVIRSEKEFIERFFGGVEPDVVMPVDFAEESLVVVALGRSSLGIGVEIVGIQSNEAGINVDYLVSMSGVRPPEDVFHNPTAMVAIAAIPDDVAVRFTESVIAFPTPVPGGPEPEPVPGDAPEPDVEQRDEPAEPVDGEVDPDFPHEGGFDEQWFEVVFQIDGRTYAGGSFWVGEPPVIPEPEPHPEPIAKADLAVTIDNAAAEVHVHLAFAQPTTVADWGQPVEGNIIFANVRTADEVDGGITEYRRSYSLRDLEPGIYHFEMVVDDYFVAAMVFFIGDEEGGDPNEFLRWLGGFLPDDGLAFPAQEKREGGEDLDGDGVSDVVEFALGLDPVNSDSIDAAVRPEVFRREDGKAHFGICFQRRQNEEADELVEYRVEASKDMVEWAADPSLFEVMEARDLGNGYEEVAMCLVEEIGGGQDHQFVRLRVIEK